MKPQETAARYNRIVDIYREELADSQYGVPLVKRAITFSKQTGAALDAGCGAGGRIINVLQQAGFSVFGVDVAGAMIERARESHPETDFEVADICTWNTRRTFDFIVAWDSLFHLPRDMHRPVLGKLSAMLRPGGVLIYTLGNEVGGIATNGTATGSTTAPSA